MTKYISIEDIRAAIQAGITILGENRVQEAKQKFAQIGPAVSWHLVGHLQTNKARPAAALFDMVQSIDSRRVADALDRETGRLDRQMDVLVEVNLAQDENKFGIALEDTEALVHYTAEKPHLRVRGLMAMAPVVPESELARPFFRDLSALFHHLRTRLASSVRWDTLSMGMSHDFEIAVEEGATLVRIGTALFRGAESPGGAV